MNKLYVFIEWDMCGIGGAQRYVSEKKRWLADRGFDVIIISALPGKMSDDADEVHHIVFPALISTPAAFGQKHLDAYLKKILGEYLNRYTEYFIETNSLSLAYWGENICSYLGGRHFIFILEERPNKINNEQKRFFQFKSYRRELAAIHADILKNIIDEENYADNNILRAKSSNPIQDISCDYNLPIDVDAKILIFSRLNKSFIRPMWKDLIRYVKRKQLTFFIGIIGSSPNGIVESMIAADCHIPNLKMEFYGEMSTISKEFIKQFDCVIAKAGCANSTVEIGVATIAYAWDEDIPAGFLGYDISTTLASSLQARPRLSELLDRIFENHETIMPCLPKKTSNADEIYGKHLLYFNSIYNVYDVYRRISPTAKDRLKALWVLLFNNSSYRKFTSKIRLVVNKSEN